MISCSFRFYLLALLSHSLTSQDDDYGGDDYGDFDMDGSDEYGGGMSGSEGGDAELENMFLEAKDMASDAEDKSTVLANFEVSPLSVHSPSC